MIWKSCRKLKRCASDSFPRHRVGMGWECEVLGSLGRGSCCLVLQVGQATSELKELRSESTQQSEVQCNSTGDVIVVEFGAWR